MIMTEQFNPTTKKNHNLIDNLVFIYDKYLHEGEVPTWLENAIDALNRNNADDLYNAITAKGIGDEG